MSSKKIIIGRLIEPYGIKGWLHLTSYTDPFENIFDYLPWEIRKNDQEPWKKLEIEAYKSHGNHFVVKPKLCNDRDTALLLKGHSIAIERSQLPVLKKNEYYWDDLIGLTVVNSDGKSLGVVDYLFETGSNDVIVTKGEKTHLIPYLPHVILSIDLEKQLIMVDWELDDAV